MAYIPADPKRDGPLPKPAKGGNWNKVLKKYQRQEVQDPKVLAELERKAKEERAERAINQELLVHQVEDARDIIRRDITKLFRDEHGIAWAYYNDGKQLRLAEIESETFCDWLRVQLDDITGKPREAWIKPLEQLYASFARRGEQVTLYLRWANINGTWKYDLGVGQILEISDQGVISHKQGEPLFRNFPHQEHYKINLEASIEDLNRLDKYLRFKNTEERELFKTCLCALFVPTIAKPINLTRGPQGSAKSFTNRLMLKLLDPSSTMEEGIPYPKKDDDWFTICREHQVLFIDNISRLSEPQQDKACTFTTGLAVEKRKLYTDRTMIGAKLKGILLINGIDPQGLKSDFNDRSLFWELERIPDEERKEELGLIDEFEEDLPFITGAVFKILAEARKHKERLKHPPELRLADFAKWSTACAIARGLNEESFSLNLKLKAHEQQEETLEQSLLTQPLITLMENRDEWKGPAKNLLRELEEQEYGEIIGEGLNEKIVVRNKPREWFKSPQGIGKEFARIGYLLPLVNLSYEKDKGTKGARVIIIKKLKPNATNATQGVLLDDKIGVHMQNNQMPPNATNATQNTKKEASGIREAYEEKSNATRLSAKYDEYKASKEKEASEALEIENINMVNDND